MLIHHLAQPIEGQFVYAGTLLAEIPGHFGPACCLKTHDQRSILGLLRSLPRVELKRLRYLGSLGREFPDASPYSSSDWNGSNAGLRGRTCRRLGRR